MEEDAVDGLSEMIYYVVGIIPPRSTTPGVLSEAEKAWNSRLLKFYAGKNRVCSLSRVSCFELNET